MKDSSIKRWVKRLCGPFFFFAMCLGQFQSGLRLQRSWSRLNLKREQFQKEAENSPSSVHHQLQKAVDCRLELQRSTVFQLEEWIAQEMPILQSVVRIDKDSVYLVTLFLPDVYSRKRRLDFHSPTSITWACHYCGNSEDETPTLANLKTSGRKEELIVQCPTKYDTSTLEGITMKMESTTTSYNATGFVRCDQLLKPALQRRWDTAPSLAAATFLRTAAPRRLVSQWVEYHRLIGVQHFFIFVHEHFHIDDGVLPLHRPYITYLPHNFCGRDAQGHSAVSQKICQTLYQFFHPVMNTEALHLGEQLGIEWVAFMDVDEYIHVHEPSQNLTSFLRALPDQPTLGGVQLKSVPYGSSPLSDKDSDDGLLIDNTWRDNIENLNSYDWHRMKHIAKPQSHVRAVGVHVNHGTLRVQPADPDSQVYLHHYKSLPGDHKGVFRATNQSDLIQDTRLRDSFQKRLAHALDDADMLYGSRQMEAV